jgi:hypothetical protein
MEKLLQDLNTFVTNLGNINYACEKSNFKKQMEKFWFYIQNYNNEKNINLFLKSEYLEEFQKIFTSYEDFYERFIELEEAVVINSKILNKDKKSVLNFNNDFISKNYHLVKNEFDMLEKKNIKTLVMVGCGSFPETILNISNNTNISQIIGVDNSNEAIAMSGNISGVMGYSEKVKFLCYDYKEFDFSGADIVFIANYTKDKNTVFKQISKTAKKGTEIIIRNPSLLSNVLYTSLNEIPKNIVLKRKKVDSKSLLLALTSLYEVV